MTRRIATASLVLAVLVLLCASLRLSVDERTRDCDRRCPDGWWAAAERCVCR